MKVPYPLLFLVVLLLSPTQVPCNALTETPPMGRATSPEVKDLRFYLHYKPTPVFVAGIGTHYVMDTSGVYSNPQPFHKPVGQPKIQVDFYLNPPLAAPVTFSGDWRVLVWVNGSALHPAGWGLQFWERSPDGAIVWDSSLLSPEVNGGPTGNPGYVDVPIFAYTLTAQGLTHTFSAGNTIEVEVTINTGSTLAARVWYDSASYPSFATFPSLDYAAPLSIATYDVNQTQRSIFSIYWEEAQRKVVVRSEIGDPFGGYDIASTRLSINDASGRAALSGQLMARISGTASSYISTYEATWGYPETAALGTYTVVVSVTDNTGNTQSKTGTFSMGVQFPISIRALDAHREPLSSALIEAEAAGMVVDRGLANSSGWLDLVLYTATYMVRVHWQGVQVAAVPFEVESPDSLVINCSVFNPVFAVVDHAGQPLESAWVFLSFANGSQAPLPMVTGNEGVIRLSQAPAGSYGLTIFWRDVLVANATILADSDGPLEVRTLVFRVEAQAVDSEHRAVEGAYITPKEEKGIILGFEVTDPSGKAFFKLPVGAYTFSTYWESVLVNRTDLRVDFDGPFLIECQVYLLTVKVDDSREAPVEGAYVVVTSEAGRVSGFALTDSLGQAEFTVPVGTYLVEGYYNGTYWLTQVSTHQMRTVAVDSDTGVSLRLEEYPPRLYLTYGFWMLVGALVASIIVGLLLWRGRKPHYTVRGSRSLPFSTEAGK